MIACLALVFALLPAVEMAAENTCSTHGVAYNNGFCPNGCYESASLVNGCYEITNAGQLYWFAAQVNGGQTTIKGKLTTNIVVNPGTFAADGSYLPQSGEIVRNWTPIGNSSYRYAGTFNGNSHTVSGLYFNNDTVDNVGLFGYVKLGCQVQNVGVVDSYICGHNNVGGVVGWNDGTVTNCHNTGAVSGNQYVGGVVGYFTGSVTNCYNTGSVTGSQFVGGVAGCSGDYNSNTVTNCYNTGTITSTSSHVGGVVGQNGSSCTVTNCYITGAVSGNGSYVGGVVGKNGGGTVTNCYYLVGCAKDGSNVDQFGIGSDTQGNTTADAAGVTTGYSDFSTGEVCYLLNGDQTTITFKQTCGTGIPTFTGNTVYYGYLSCGDAVYTNDSDASGIRPEHTDIAYTDNNDGTHTWNCGICGGSGAESHDHTDNKACVCGKKITPEVTAPSAKEGLIYDGTSQALINPGSTTGGTLKYSLDNASWSAEIPSATNAGEYTVYYKVVGNENYDDVAAQSVTVTVIPVNVSGATVTLGTVLTYTGTAQTQTIVSVIVNGLTLTAGDYTVTGNQQTGVGDYTLTVTGKGNFTGSVTKDWSIAKAPMTITADNVTVLVGRDAPAEAALTYTVTGLVGGDTAESALSVKPVLSYSPAPDTTQAGSYTIAISGATADNYDITHVDGTLTVSVAGSDAQYAGSVTIPFTIAQRPLTLKADNTPYHFFQTAFEMKRYGRLIYAFMDVLFLHRIRERRNCAAPSNYYVLCIPKSPMSAKKDPQSDSSVCLSSSTLSSLTMVARAI